MTQQTTPQYPVIDINKSHNLQDFMTMADRLKPLFIASVPRKENLFGVPAKSGTLNVPCLLDESTYKLSDNYKIGLRPVDDEGFCSQTYYLSDFVILVREGHIQLIDQKAPMIEPKKPSLMSRFASWVYCKMTKFPCY